MKFKPEGNLYQQLFQLCMNKDTTSLPNIRIHPIRLKPGQDLRKEIQAFVDNNQIEAGWIASAAGSLTAYAIRYANQSDPATGHGYFEIVGLSGIISVNGSHIHICIADEKGVATGGHLADGCIIYTTAEIIIQSSDAYVFERANDGTTPWKELQVFIK